MIHKDHGVGSSDHFSALKIWMFENKFVSLPSHLKTIEPMARPIRKKSGTGIYHVMLRGINRQDIFEDEEDYRQMTSILRGLTDRYDEQGLRSGNPSDLKAYRCILWCHSKTTKMIRRTDPMIF